MSEIDTVKERKKGSGGKRANSGRKSVADKPTKHVIYAEVSQEVWDRWKLIKGAAKNPEAIIKLITAFENKERLKYVYLDNSAKI